MCSSIPDLWTATLRFFSPCLRVRPSGAAKTVSALWLVSTTFCTNSFWQRMQLQPLAYPQIKFVSTFLASNRIHFGFMNVHVFKVSVSVHTEEHFSRIFLFLCGRFLFPNRQLFSYIQSNPFSLNNHPSCHCHSGLVAVSRYMQRVLFHRAPSSVFCLFFFSLLLQTTCPLILLTLLSAQCFFC